MTKEEQILTTVRNLGRVLRALDRRNEALEAYNEAHPFGGGGAYADAAYDNQPERQALYRQVKASEDAEWELKCKLDELAKEYC